MSTYTAPKRQDKISLLGRMQASDEVEIQTGPTDDFKPSLREPVAVDELEDDDEEKTVRFQDDES